MNTDNAKPQAKTSFPNIINEVRPRNANIGEYARVLMLDFIALRDYQVDEYKTHIQTNLIDKQIINLQEPIIFSIPGWTVNTEERKELAKRQASVIDAAFRRPTTLIIIDFPAGKKPAPASFISSINLVQLRKSIEAYLAEHLTIPQQNATKAGFEFGDVLTAIVRLNSEANLGVLAHSLGTEVALVGVTYMGNDTKLTMLSLMQPAVGTTAFDQHRTLSGSRISQLFIGVNVVDIPLLFFAIFFPRDNSSASGAQRKNILEKSKVIIERLKQEKLVTKIIDHFQGVMVWKENLGHYSLDPKVSKYGCKFQIYCLAYLKGLSQNNIPDPCP